MIPLRNSGKQESDIIKYLIYLYSRPSHLCRPTGPLGTKEDTNPDESGKDTCVYLHRAKE